MKSNTVPKDSFEAFGVPPAAVTYLPSPSVAEPKYPPPRKNLPKFPFSKDVQPGKRPLWTTLRPVVADLNEYLKPKKATAHHSIMVENNMSMATQVRDRMQNNRPWERKTFQRRNDNGPAAERQIRDPISERIRQRVLYIVGTEPTAMQDKLTATKLYDRDELFLQEGALKGHPENESVIQRHKLSKTLRERFELLGKESVQVIVSNLNADH